MARNLPWNFHPVATRATAIQQNTAMVEEASAASAALANEGATLHELISQFNVSAPVTEHAYSLRKTG